MEQCFQMLHGVGGIIVVLYCSAEMIQNLYRLQATAWKIPGLDKGRHKRFLELCPWNWPGYHGTVALLKKKDVELQQIVNVDMWSYHTADIGPVKWSLGHIATVEIAESRPCQLPFAGKSLCNSSPGLELQCANMKKRLLLTTHELWPFLWLLWKCQSCCSFSISVIQIKIIKNNQTSQKK